MAYNIIDGNENVITENITEQETLDLIESNGQTEFSYFFYPLDSAILVELQEKFQNDLTALRFFKRIEEEA